MELEHAKASEIQAIDRQSVHRICSGQVVLNLATAVKELVENSLDAGATNIDVRLKEYGSELVEVSDNGSGVEAANFQGLTLKHHTSKLKDFSDLTSVDTFGFRGEALSSLCALSSLSIVTCHKDTSVGAKLDYDFNGKLVQQTPCPRQQGTTVTIQQIFSTLPVRHKEFLRNLKKEFAKMVGVLNAYCIISTGVKITCTNQVAKGKKNIIVNTNGNISMKENITNIFGPKQMHSLLRFAQHCPNEDAITDYGIKAPDTDKQIFKIDGYVSTCEHGKGRSSTDRQYYFVNKRPCDLIKVSKLVNEVYHMYNRHQYPFIVLDISLAKDAVDVNVTPDKRQIFLQHERLLYGIIKTSLVKIFEPKSSVYHVNEPALNTKAGSLGMFSRASVGSADSVSPISLSKMSSQDDKKHTGLSSLKRSFASAFSKNTNDSTLGITTKDSQQKQRKLDSFVSQHKSVVSVCDGNSEEYGDILLVDKLIAPPNAVVSSPCLDSGVSCPTTSSDSQEVITLPSSLENSTANNSDCESQESECMPHDTENVVLCDNVGKQKDFTRHDSNLVDNETDLSCKRSISKGGDNLVIKVKTSNSDFRSVYDRQKIVSSGERFTDTNVTKDVSSRCSNATSNVSKSFDRDEWNPTKTVKEKETECSTYQEEGIHLTYTEFDEKESIQRKEVNTGFSWRILKTEMQKRQNKKNHNQELCRSFRATITPGDNQAAEEELKREISKDSFTKMNILGQFNLGFIIVQLNQDLFIIDQHATDEKYNFEMLKKHTVIQSQKLIQPQSLELTAMNETILIDNLDIFQKNGFEFRIDEEAPPTQRVNLVSLPMSKNWTFGKDDIEELIFMLTDSPGIMCRPSRIRQMFASRACRKSIMIGTALNKAEMRKLIVHMGGLDQPWNCPHGRPTMRHLINMNMLPE